MASTTCEQTSLPYPGGLSIEQVQILVRHGERSPIWPRFQNTGLSPYWPYCSAAQRFSQVIMTSEDGSKWASATWKRHLEISGRGGRSIAAPGPRGETNNMCMPGELTDRGRETSLAFGKLLRQRYIEQLNLLPKYLSDASELYIRTTEVPRVIESMHQILHGLYPPSTNRSSSPWDIMMRPLQEETLRLNIRSCARLAELTREFAHRAAAKWHGSEDMKYLSDKLGHWMPGNRPLGVHSRPSIAGVLDTINATAAHGPETRLPSEFYDEKVRRVIDHIAIDEAFHGYSVSREFRMLGIGQLLGGMVLKMVDQVDWNRRQDIQSRSVAPPKLSLLGCHDRTIGTVLASLGCLDDDEKWPPFTCHIIFELFHKRGTSTSNIHQKNQGLPNRNNAIDLISTTGEVNAAELSSIGQRPVRKLTREEVQQLDEYFVRVKYNDRIITVPGCRGEGKHFGEDATLCTLSAFKSVVDNFTPKRWQLACNSNLGALSTTEGDEPAGY